MSSLPYSSDTIAADSPPAPAPALDLSSLPPVFVLPTHLAVEELQELEDRLGEYGAPMTFDATEAKLFIGKVGTKRRAEMELRSRKLWTEEVKADPVASCDAGTKPPRKKRKVGDVPAARRNEALDESTTEDEMEEESRKASRPLKTFDDCGGSQSATEDEDTDTVLPFSASDFPGIVKVIKMNWLDDSSSAGKLLPLKDYLVYEGKPIERPSSAITPQPASQGPFRKPMDIFSRTKLAEKPMGGAKTELPNPDGIADILERAKADAADSTVSERRRGHGKFTLTRGEKNTDAELSHSQATKDPSKLLQQTTSEYEGVGSELPDPPDWVKKNIKYACERSTPANPPNENFIEQLKKIRLARLLTGDEIGVRAYSTSIAAIAAYPYHLTSPKEILSLPGCDVKIANLWIEWKNNDGVIRVVEEAESDEDMKVLRLFYDIWGVGATTAREFCYERGWRDLDDIVEYGWPTLTRVQQIGVKYHSEFQTKIPRPEVSSIAATIHAHATKVRDSGIETIIVGGYRRGKQASGDVDVVVSHRDLAATANLVTDIVASLEAEDWITHTLLLGLTGTERGQSTLPFRSSSGGHGFDTLDKALVVWQDPNWPTKTADLAANPKAKNPNVHRRVDIIVSPWRTVGCAVVGWSGGTTFQRDLRRFAKNVRGWKFDSSGVRDRGSGKVVEFEGREGVDGGWEDAERKVFEGFGLVWRAPAERCTE
ncbi:Nucleotidyltransferase [Saccharata proteae CBS 121410]|uniref:DNA-directed DNA polymerase n=1 Tax=Saccharata proteae CBS 121410 TaxID=1314787 RepID=A0A9P4HU01_9PEZI|nr:Nucleotidyltransferase [Saccharata proteae CBS 121410]